MYCIQCEETIRTPKAVGCSYKQGSCGKTAETSDLQDLLIAVLQGLSAWALEARKHQIIDEEIDAFVPKAFFATLTNVNFDSDRIIDYARQAIQYRRHLEQLCRQRAATIKVEHPYAALQLQGYNAASLEAQAKEFSLSQDANTHADIQGMRLLCLYGLKGAAAYIEHAHALGRYDQNITAQFHEYMALSGQKLNDLGALLDLAMNIGKMNFSVMAMLDAGETAAYGDPEPSTVNLSPVAGKAILISGHDLKDLYDLLQQTEGSGINIYTHGEMLPAHSYPELKRFKHLVGNYGSGWQNQQKEFAQFPGPIVMTSNCIIDPNPGNYLDRIWTRNVVGWPGAKHLENTDFSGVIAQAKAMPGYASTEPERRITIGFGRKTLLGAADTVLQLVGNKQLRRVFLVGGCDGNNQERHYYSDFAQAVPKDCLIMTLACGKYRLNNLDLGELAGLPRLLDVGQCNDAYSAIVLAVKLAEKAGCTVNDLPLTLVLSWFEQKAIVILLTLLALGVKNIYVGPTVPAFLTPNLVQVLHDKFGLNPTGNAEQDLATILRN